jgi:ribosome maturation factor RimP
LRHIGAYATLNLPIESALDEWAKSPLFVYLGDFFGGNELKGDLAERVKESTGDLLAGLFLELVDISVTRERGRTFVRMSVDKAGGVTLDECASANNLIGQVLDREEVITGPYVLEVMSPGIDRPLRRPEDFERSVGKRVKVKLRQPFEGKISYSGILREAAPESFVLDMGDEVLELKYANISGARLYPELPW